MAQLLNENLAKSVSEVAYDLANQLRVQYLDNGLVIPIDARQQAIAVLMENFAISQTQAEAALAAGFFESR